VHTTADTLTFCGARQQRRLNIQVLCRRGSRNPRYVNRSYKNTSQPTCKTGTFQLLQYLSKNTGNPRKPGQPDATERQPNQGVRPVERSQSGNDSSASCSQSCRRRVRRVRVHMEFSPSHAAPTGTRRATGPRAQREPHLVVVLGAAHGSIAWAVAHAVERRLRTCAETRGRTNRSSQTATELHKHESRRPTCKRT